MSLFKWNKIVYAINLALLFTHEIDSAYWQEWNLFGLPGGIQLFLILNLILLVLSLYGYSGLLHDQRPGYVVAIILSVSGIFAFSIHSYFILTGHSEFTLPASEILLFVMLLISLLQATLLILTVKKKSASAA
jgi:hypothetical protein